MALENTDVYRVGVSALTKQVLWDSLYNLPPTTNFYTIQKIENLNDYLVQLSVKY